jgi:hypothetical protein
MGCTIELNGNNYVFANESFSNSRNWGHKSQLRKNGCLIGENKSIYINRTWESYQYQSCMKSIVCNLIKKNGNDYINSYKADNNIKRLSSVKRDKLIDESNGLDSELYELLNRL